MDPEIGVPLVRKGGFAYHAHPEAVYPLIDKLYDNHEICELTEVNLARPAYTMFAVTNNCTFTEIMRVGYYATVIVVNNYCQNIHHS